MVEKFLNTLKTKGWKQKDIATKTGYAPNFISKLFNGGNCRIETIIKLADTFGVTTDEVLGRSPARTIIPEEKMILETTQGNREIARAALRSAQGEKLIREKGTMKAA